MNYREKIRKAIACPQFGDTTYGEWEELTLEQRRYIKELLDELDRADNYSKNLYFENKQLKDNWNELKEIIRKKQDYYRHFKDNRYRRFLSELLDKMQELKGSDSDE